MDLNGFDANEVEPANNYEPMPKGWYTGMIIESEEKETKARNGTYLQLTIEITDGPFKGRKLWDRLNLNNPNQVAVDIARRTLAAICLAVGVAAPKDSSDLHFKPMGIRVGVDKNDAERNEVKGYRALAGAPTAARPASSPAQAQGQAAKQAPPWQRKAG